MTTWDANMVAEHVLCTHPNHYPYFETDVLPGTDWEIEQYAANQFYAYRFDAESGQQAYILNDAGYDKLFPSRDEALAAIMQAEAQEIQASHQTMERLYDAVQASLDAKEAQA